MADEGYLKRPTGFATKAVQAGQDLENWKHAVVPPIVTSTTYKRDDPGVSKGYGYSRTGNPTRNALEKTIATLENAKYGLCFSSGVGATSCIASLLSSGDHIVCCDDLYGGTYKIFGIVLPKIGIECTFVNFLELENVEKAITSKTKMVWLETPTNPLMSVIDIEAVANITKKHKDIFLVVDNTFLSPYLQRPLDFGADIVFYSLTKYMNGHSDVGMGGTVTNSSDLYERMKYLQNALGNVPGPFDCYQVQRGLKTLAVRMKQHMASSLEVAKWLSNHPMVEKVMHPGLPSHPQHELSKRQCYGNSGMLSFYIKGEIEQASEFLKRLRVFILAGSLGGCESLAQLPLVMTHTSIPPEHCKAIGITGSLIRLSIGLEDTEDLIEDLNQALVAAGKI